MCFIRIINIYGTVGYRLAEVSEERQNEEWHSSEDGEERIPVRGRWKTKVSNLSNATVTGLRDT